MENNIFMTQSETKNKTQSETENKTQSETKNKTQSETENKTQSETKNKTQSKTKSNLPKLQKLGSTVSFFGQEQISRSRAKASAIQAKGQYIFERYNSKETNKPKTEAEMRQIEAGNRLLQQSLESDKKIKSAPNSFYETLSEEIRQKQKQISKNQNNFIKHKTNEDYKETMITIRKTTGLKEETTSVGFTLSVSSFRATL